MSRFIENFVSDFALALRLVDQSKPQASNARSGQLFRPGIGPHTEAQTVELVTKALAVRDQAQYGRCRLNVRYPENPRQKCDVGIGDSASWEWAIEVKMVRILGDNGKVNDNILMHILSPYPQHRSAITDCEKLAQSDLGKQKAILIYGYDHTKWPLDPLIEAFEMLAATKVSLGQRYSATFDGLVHPVHSKGTVFGWEIHRKE